MTTRSSSGDERDSPAAFVSPPALVTYFASRSVRRLLVVVLVTLAVRLVVFPVNEYVHGDAVPRIELAEAWAERPHLIESFGDGAAQYGPLHVYLLGAALQVVDRNDAARVVNLVAGVATAVPMALVAGQYFGATAAVWAGLGFALWGLHVQASTTGGSEAVALGLMWATFLAMARLLDRPRVRTLVALALALNLAAATRYDAWMYVPILAACPLLQWPDRARALRWAVATLLAGLVFPLWWMYGNFEAHGDPLYPLHYIDAFHAQWAAGESAGPLRQLWFRAQGLGFWPAMALVTLSPGLALLGVYGMRVAWVERADTRWLIAAAALPALYYTVRAAVLVDFVPLARFTVVQVSALLPFVWTGAQAVARRHGRASVVWMRSVWVMAVLLPVAIGALTVRNDHRVARAIAGISPASTNPRTVMAVATLVRTAIERGETVALDVDATYQDIQLGFYARLPLTAPRLRWPGFREQITATPPDLIVTFEHGQLIAESWVRRDASGLSIAGERYVPAGADAGVAVVWCRLGQFRARGDEGVVCGSRGADTLDRTRPAHASSDARFNRFNPSPVRSPA